MCSANVLLSLISKSGAQTKASIQRFSINHLNSFKSDENTPKSVKALVSIIIEDTILDPIDNKEADNLCKDILPYSCLRTLIPAVKMLPLSSGNNIDNITAILTNLLPTPRTRLEFHTYRQGFKTLQLMASTEDYTQALITFFTAKRHMPHLNKLLDYDSLDNIKDTSSFYSLVRTIIEKGNLTNKASVDLALYYVFQRESASETILRLSLFTDFCLKMLDNRYFDMLKDFLEDFFANQRPTVA